MDVAAAGSVLGRVVSGTRPIRHRLRPPKNLLLVLNIACKLDYVARHDGVCEGGESRWPHGRPKRARSWKWRTQPRKNDTCRESSTRRDGLISSIITLSPFGSR